MPCVTKTVSFSRGSVSTVSTKLICLLLPIVTNFTSYILPLTKISVSAAKRILIPSAN